MAPEQAAGDREAADDGGRRLRPGGDPVRVLTGRPPFGGDDVAGDAARRCASASRRRRARLNPRRRRDLETICLKCLEKDPAAALRLGRGAGRRPRPLAARRADRGPAGRRAPSGLAVVPPQPDGDHAGRGGGRAPGIAGVAGGVRGIAAQLLAGIVSGPDAARPSAAGPFACHSGRRGRRPRPERAAGGGRPTGRNRDVGDHAGPPDRPSDDRADGRVRD